MDDNDTTSLSNPLSKVFQSSQIQSGTYDPSTRTLTIQFTNSTTYVYSSVPPEVWSRLISASSPGSYFSQFVKPNYQYRKMPE